MTEELKELFEALELAIEKVSMCCGCNTFSVDNAITDIKDYLKERGTM